MLFKVAEDGAELTCSVADATEKAAKLAEGWQTRYLAWCDGPLPEPESAPDVEPQPDAEPEKPKRTRAPKGAASVN